MSDEIRTEVGHHVQAKLKPKPVTLQMNKVDRERELLSQRNENFGVKTWR